MNLRAVEVFRPYPGEFPDELFASAGSDEIDYRNVEFVRIAKYEGAIIGAYAMRVDTRERYVLMSIVVDQRVRKQGLGRWLVGHAIGVAESKGARSLFVPYQANRRFFARIGFAQDGSGLRYDLVPE